MFAIIETGGKQYRIKRDMVIQVEKLDESAGERIEFDKVLLIADAEKVTVGNPYINGSKVQARVIDQIRGKKIRVFKMKRRKRYRKTLGHRQYITKVRIDEIIEA